MKRLLALLIALGAYCSGCGRSGNDIFLPADPDTARRDIQVASGSIPVPQHLRDIVANGDSVFISGSICKTWTPTNYAVQEPFGVIQNGVITGSYQRMIDGARTFGCELWIAHDRSRYRVFDGIPVNNNILTAISSVGETPQNRFSFVRVFEVMEWGDGMYLVNTIRDDNGVMAKARFRYTGKTASPDSSYLNDPARQDMPVNLISAWSNFEIQSGSWQDASWQQDIALPAGTWYLRPEDSNGAFKRTGCFLGDLELVHMANIIEDNQHPYLGFLVESRDGHFVNAGPDNRYGGIFVGAEAMVPKGASVRQWVETRAQLK